MLHHVSYSIRGANNTNETHTVLFVTFLAPSLSVLVNVVLNSPHYKTDLMFSFRLSAAVFISCFSLFVSISYHFIPAYILIHPKKLYSVIDCYYIKDFIQKQ